MKLNLSKAQSQDGKLFGDCADEKKTEDANPMKKERSLNFEILRVLAMFMVIVLHYLSKGNLLTDLSVRSSASDLSFWALEALCLVSVNVYVLISGYFLVESRFSLPKLINLWCRILFYSIGVALVLMISGVVDYHNYLDLFDLQFFCFPTINGHYWFATAYLLFYILAPFLGIAAKAMSKKELKLLICLLLIPFCLVKSILPFQLPIDDLGNSFVWFLCLFFVAAYLRLYPISVLNKARNGWMLYIFSAIGILLSLLAAVSLIKQTGHYEYALTISSNYNFIFVFTGSVGLFCAFKNMKVKSNKVTRFLARIAPYTFGVYLLHEHLLLRYEWLKWFKVSESYGVYRVMHLILSVLIIFSVGIIVDFIRSLLFQWISRLIVFALKIYYAKREVWDYLIFGGLTTVVNLVVYIAFAYCFFSGFWQQDPATRKIVCNVIAWIAAVLFAYWTNRKFVFRSTATAAGAIFREFVSFISARIFSFLVENAMFFVFVKMMSMNDLISKLIIGVVVIILNYIFSKLWIFKKKA